MTSKKTFHYFILVSAFKSFGQLFRLYYYSLIKIFHLQLTVNGVYLMTGQSALLLVEEEVRPGVEPAPTLYQLMVD